MSHEIHEDALVALVAAIRAADERYHRGDGHYVRECLLPEFAAHDIALVLHTDSHGEILLKPDAEGGEHHSQAENRTGRPGADRAAVHAGDQ